MNYFRGFVLLTASILSLYVPLGKIWSYSITATYEYSGSCISHSGGRNEPVEYSSNYPLVIVNEPGYTSQMLVINENANVDVSCPSNFSRSYRLFTGGLSTFGPDVIPYNLYYNNYSYILDGVSVKITVTGSGNFKFQGESEYRYISNLDVIEDRYAPVPSSWNKNCTDGTWCNQYPIGSKISNASDKGFSGLSIDSWDFHGGGAYLSDSCAENKELSRYAKDGVGHITEENYYDDLNIDRTTPVFSSISFPSDPRVNGYLNASYSDYEINLAGEDDCSGVEKFDYEWQDSFLTTTSGSVSSEETVEAGANYGLVSVASLADGKYRLRGKALDQASNSTTYSDWSDAQLVYIDRTPPGINTTNPVEIVLPKIDTAIPEWYNRGDLSEDRFIQVKGEDATSGVWKISAVINGPSDSTSDLSFDDTPGDTTYGGAGSEWINQKTACSDPDGDPLTDDGIPDPENTGCTNYDESTLNLSQTQDLSTFADGA